MVRKMHVMDVGSGEQTFLFLHGLGGNHEQFQAQMEFFSRRGRVLVPDLPGHGLSPKPERDYTLDFYVDEVRKLVTEPVTLVGFSLGGSIGLQFTHRFPELVEAFVSIDTALPFNDPMREQVSRFIRWIEQGEAKQVVSMLTLSTDRYREEIARAFLATPSHVLISSFRELLALDVTHSLRSLSCPFLYIKATNITRVEELQELCPHMFYGKTVGTGHNAPMEAPMQVNGMIDSFLRCL